MSAPEKTYYPKAGISIQRMETFSDIVFAVTIGILVFDIRVPVKDLIKSESHLFAVFITLLPKYLCYFMSFTTLGVSWISQSARYTCISRSDRNLNWLTLLFLLFVSALPLSTAFLGQYIHFKFPVFVYWLNILLLGLAGHIQWKYAYYQGYLNMEGPECEALNKVLRRRLVLTQLMYTGAALLCFITSYLTIAAIIFIQVNKVSGTFFRVYIRKRA